MESPLPSKKSFEENVDKVDPDLPLPEDSKSEDAVETPANRRNFWLKFSACFFATFFIAFFFLFFWKLKYIPDYFEPCFYKDKISENDMFYLYIEVEVLHNKTAAIEYLLNISSISPHLQEPLTQELKITKADFTDRRSKYQTNREQWKLCYDRNVMIDLNLPNALYKAFLNVYSVAIISMTSAAIYFYIKSENKKLTKEQRQTASELYSAMIKYGFGHLLSLLIVFGIKSIDNFDVGFDLFMPETGTCKWLIFTLKS